MGVDEGNIQVIDVEVIMENFLIVLLYDTYLRVVAIMAIVIYTMLYGHHI